MRASLFIRVGGVFVAHNGSKGRVHDEPFSLCLSEVCWGGVASMWVYVSWQYAVGVDCELLKSRRGLLPAGLM